MEQKIGRILSDFRL